LLIADDLTGACDAAVPFVGHGYRATVLLDLDRAELHDGVLAVNTDSRNDNSCDMHRVACAFRGVRPRILFKKIDSTLRGSAGAEVAAALEAFGCEAAVITPAFPGTGRIVEAGRLRVVDRDDFEPVDVAEHFGPHGLTQFLAGDVVSDADLDQVVAEGLAARRRILWVGSGGLAAALARAIARPKGAADKPRTPGKVLFVIGSDHPVTLEQQRHLLEAHPDSAVLHLECGLGGRLAQARGLAGALFLSGGDTAAMVCRTIEARAIELDDELITGIPLGRIAGGWFDGVPVVTKSGGFGRPDALIQVVEYFTCR